jgi:hypothetical protein
MLTMKNSCLVLDNVVCAGADHSNCPREFLPFWREIWLERVDSSVEHEAVAKEGDRAAGSGCRVKTA